MMTLRKQLGAVVQAMEVLASASGSPTAPDVAARLSAFVRADPRALAELAQTLTPEQLSGVSRLPDPLPCVAAVRRAVTDGIAALSPAQRRVARIAAHAISDRADLIISASAVGADVLLSWQHPILHIADGRFSFADERFRSFLMHDANEAERLDAHRALFRAASMLGDTWAAAWHGASAGGKVQTAVLLEGSRVRSLAGHPETAAPIAAAVVRQSTGAAQFQAIEAFATASFWAGHLHDAEGAMRDLPAATRRDSVGAGQLHAAIRLLRAAPEPVGDQYALLARYFRVLGAAARGNADQALFRALYGVADSWWGDAHEADDVWANYLLGRGRLDASSSGSPTDPNVLSPLGAAVERMNTASWQLHFGDITSARATLVDTALRYPVVHLGYGVMPSLLRRLFADESSDVEALVVAFEEIRRGSNLQFVPVDTAAGAMSAAAARKLTGRPAVARGALERLSTREQQIVSHAASGKTTSDIAACLGISPRTAETHLTRIYRKLGVRTRSELLVLVLAGGAPQ